MGNDSDAAGLGEYELKVMRSVFVALRDVGIVGVDSCELWPLLTADERVGAAQEFGRKLARIASLAGHAASLLGEELDGPVTPKEHP